MLPIFNHLHFLNNAGSLQVRMHQPRDTTKMFFMSCGCVVIADYNDLYKQYRHYTTPCAAHNVLRQHNYSFDFIKKYNDRMNGIMQIEGDNITHSLYSLLEKYWFQVTPDSEDAMTITEPEAIALFNLPVGESCQVGTCKVKRIS